MTDLIGGSIEDLQGLYETKKKDIFIPSLKKLESEQGDKGMVYGYIADNLNNFIEFSDWFFDISKDFPDKTPIPIRTCLENFVEINYLLSQLFIGYSDLERDILTLIFKKELKLWKKSLDFINAGIVGDKTKDFEDNSELNSLIQLGYQNTISFGTRLNLDTSKYTPIESVNTGGLEDSFKTKVYNAHLSHPDYWWNAYSFLSQFTHTSRTITNKLIPRESRLNACTIWYKKMLELLSTTLEKSEL